MSTVRADTCWCVHCLNFRQTKRQSTETIHEQIHSDSHKRTPRGYLSYLAALVIVGRDDENNIVHAAMTDLLDIAAVIMEAEIETKLE